MVGARSMVRSPLATTFGRTDLAAGDEGGAHVDVGGQVLHIRHVAVLAEEGRAGHQRAGCFSVELVRRIGKDNQIAGAGGVSHIGGAVRAVGDVARFGLGDRPDRSSSSLPAAPSPVQSLGSLKRQEGGFDLGDGGSFIGRGDLRKAAARRIAAGQVQVDLNRAAGPAGLGLADGLTGGRAAVGGLRLGEQAQVDQHLAGVDGQELRGKAVIGRDKGVELFSGISDLTSARVASAPW